MVRRVCYVTGTRAEFGLMKSTLRAIQAQAGLNLQLVVTGMHLSRAHGRTIDQIRRDGWKVDATVPWGDSKDKDDLAAIVGGATAAFARVFALLDPDIVLVCGDRVEPFAAASAAHVAGRVVAHVHGGDRALGQVDDALRHAISKLAHLHFCATKLSHERLFRMGEDRFRIHRVGTPGVDGIRSIARENPHDPVDAVVAFHPESADEVQEYRRAKLLLKATRSAIKGSIVIVHPNNDPGWRGVAKAIAECDGAAGIDIVRDVPRDRFIGLLASTRVLIGNSSAGIIEAASLGTRVVNVGDRQLGRERSANVIDVGWTASSIERAIRRASASKFAGRNVYGGGKAGERIARTLSDVVLDEKLRRKLIRY